MGKVRVGDSTVTTIERWVKFVGVLNKIRPVAVSLIDPPPATIAVPVVAVPEVSGSFFATDETPSATGPVVPVVSVVGADRIVTGRLRGACCLSTKTCGPVSSLASLGFSRVMEVSFSLGTTRDYIQVLTLPLNAAKCRGTAACAPFSVVLFTVSATLYSSWDVVKVVNIPPSVASGPVSLVFFRGDTMFSGEHLQCSLLLSEVSGALVIPTTVTKTEIFRGEWKHRH